MKSRGSPRCCARSTISLYVTVNDVFFFSMKRYVTMCPSIGRVVFRLFGDTYPDPILLVSVLLLSFSDICEPFGQNTFHLHWFGSMATWPQMRRKALDCCLNFEVWTLLPEPTAFVMRVMLPAISVSIIVLNSSGPSTMYRPFTNRMVSLSR